MAKLADLRANLSIEEREEYEKYKNTKIKDDDIKIMDEKDGASSSTSRNGMQGCFFFSNCQIGPHLFRLCSLKLSKLSEIGQTLF